MKHILHFVLIIVCTAAIFAGIPRTGFCHQPVVLFDQGHGQRFVIQDDGMFGLSGLAGKFQEQGFAVKSTKQTISDAELATADVLVISGPFQPFMPSEIESIAGFLNKGGRLCVMLHISSPVVNLLQRIKVFTSNGVIREQQNIIEDNPMDFQVKNLASHGLTTGLQEFNVFGGWALMSDDMEKAQFVAQTSDQAWVDLDGDKKLGANDAKQALCVIVAGQVGSGTYVVFGDDAIFQNRFLTGGNEILAKNLAAWLSGLRL
jgi:hypothetical protein